MPVRSLGRCRRRHPAERCEKGRRLNSFASTGPLIFGPMIFFHETRWPSCELLTRSPGHHKQQKWEVWISSNANWASNEKSHPFSFKVGCPTANILVKHRSIHLTRNLTKSRCLFWYIIECIVKRQEQSKPLKERKRHQSG